MIFRYHSRIVHRPGPRLDRETITGFDLFGLAILLYAWSGKAPIL